MTASYSLAVPTFALYLAAMVLIGAVAYRRTRGLADYVLGGRSLNSWVAALSAGASDMSGWLLLGLPGYAYLSGLEAGWIAIGLWLGTYLNWRLVAARLRELTYRAGNALTLSDYLERRFADHSRLLRVVSALLILGFFSFYTASGLVAGGKLFASVFGLPYSAAVLAGALVIVAYTFLGGFLAVSWTDVVQGLLMAFALLWVPVAALHAAGGTGAVVEAAARLDPALLDLWPAGGEGRLPALPGVVSLLGWGLGYFGQPHILARFMAIRSGALVPSARRIAMTWVTLTMAGALLAGWAGIGVMPGQLQGAEAEKVFIHLIGALFHPLPAGVLLAAILAAIMSTVDSQLLVASSALTEDLYKGFLRPGAGQPELVRIGRLGVLLIAAVALALAMDPQRKVLELVAYAWAGFGAAFGPVLLLSLYWTRMTGVGALAGMLVGGTTVVAWKQLEGGIFDLYELVPGFVLALAAIVLGSRRGQPPASARSLFRFREAGSGAGMDTGVGLVGDNPVRSVRGRRGIMTGVKPVFYPARSKALIGLLLLSALALAKADPRQWEYMAELGDVASQMRLADAYLNGKGVAVDHRRAAYWYGRAAAQGDPAGQAFLGWMYERGLGLERSLEIARYWYSKSAGSGYAWAVRRLRELDAERERPEPRAAQRKRPDAESEAGQADEGRAAESDRAASEPQGVSRAEFTAPAGGEGSGVEETRPRAGYPGETSSGLPAKTEQPRLLPATEDLEDRESDGRRRAPLAEKPEDTEARARRPRLEEARREAAESAAGRAAGEAAPALAGRSALDELEKSVRDLVQRTLVLKTPERMDPGEERWASAGFERDPAYDRLLAPGVGVRMIAELKGEGVDIEPASSPRQVLRPGIPPHWAWRIASRAKGERRLHLLLKARVTLPVHGSRSFSLPPREQIVDARPRAWSSLRRFVDENLLAIVVTLLIPLSIWVGLSLRSAKAD
jgi:sodium/proline symporter